MSEKKQELIVASLGLILVGILIICAAFDMPGLFADKNTDEEVIIITKRVEITEVSERSIEASEDVNNDITDNNYDYEYNQDSYIETGKVNINTASFEELTGISGIGSERAQAIIEYREEFNGFDSIEELTNIYGIGESTVEDIKDNVTVE